MRTAWKEIRYRLEWLGLKSARVRILQFAIARMHVRYEALLMNDFTA